jgi:hypothetical protein
VLAVLKEFAGLSQEKTGFRRLFTDEYFDLYLWYERKGGDLKGFQLCYDRSDDPHSLTCYPGKYSIHTRIDDGEADCGNYKASPILVSDGVFEKSRVLHRFEFASEGIDEDIRELVLRTIEDYGG